MAAKSRYLRQMNGARSCNRRRARGEVAGNRARLDQGRALPVLAEALVVVERGIGRRRASGVEPGSGRRRRSVRNT